jgi:hypothetical protein
MLEVYAITMPTYFFVENADIGNKERIFQRALALDFALEAEWGKEFWLIVKHLTQHQGKNDECCVKNTDIR